MANTAPGIKNIHAGEPKFAQMRTTYSPFSDHPLSLRSEDQEVDNGALRSESESRSSQKTREALLILDEYPADPNALYTLWNENHLAFESQMRLHLDSPDSPALLQRVLAAVVSVCRFYCDEVDDPKAWVARCANLETRRVALQLNR